MSNRLLQIKQGNGVNKIRPKSAILLDGEKLRIVVTMPD